MSQKIIPKRRTKPLVLKIAQEFFLKVNTNDKRAVLTAAYDDASDTISNALSQIEDCSTDN